MMWCTWSQQRKTWCKTELINVLRFNQPYLRFGCYCCYSGAPPPLLHARSTEPTSTTLESQVSCAWWNIIWIEKKKKRWHMDDEVTPCYLVDPTPWWLPCISIPQGPQHATYSYLWAWHKFWTTWLLFHVQLATYLQPLHETNFHNTWFSQVHVTFLSTIMWWEMHIIVTRHTYHNMQHTDLLSHDVHFGGSHNSSLYFSHCRVVRKKVILHDEITTKTLQVAFTTVVEISWAIAWRREFEPRRWII